MRPIFAALAALAAATPAIAGPGHTHGRADLAIIGDGHALVIELRADLLDLVGFEHAPRTEAERTALASLRERMTAGAPPFRPSERAGCAVEDAAVTGGPGSDATAEGGHDDHILTVTWTWRCAAPDRLAEIETSLFTEFPAITRVDAVILTDAGQTAAALTAQRPSARLPR
jgi:hypothetical protein